MTYLFSYIVLILLFSIFFSSFLVIVALSPLSCFLLFLFTWPSPFQFSLFIYAIADSLIADTRIAFVWSFLVQCDHKSQIPSRESRGTWLNDSRRKTWFTEFHQRNSVEVANTIFSWKYLFFCWLIYYSKANACWESKKRPLLIYFHTYHHRFYDNKLCNVMSDPLTRHAQYPMQRMKLVLIDQQWMSGLSVSSLVK